MLRPSAVAVALLLSLPVRAEVSGPPVEYQVLPEVLAGSRDRPTLTVVANEDVDAVEVKLKRDDGKAQSFRSGALKAGQSRKFVLDVPPGREYQFHAVLNAQVGAETRGSDFDFNAEIVKPAQLTLDKAKVDLAAHTFEVASTRKMARIEIQVTGDEGEDMGKTELPMEVAPGTSVKVEWKQGGVGGRVMKITIKIFDPDEFYSGVELYPWRVDIPHEEVNFASGSFQIDKGEEPKLSKSMEAVAESVQKYGRWADIKLFVAGHTDTVGPKDYNRTLSFNRAKSISEWFRRHGLRIPILYDGFGEEALAVSTPDETAAAANRRAEYIVAIEPPEISADRAAAWKRVP